MPSSSRFRKLIGPVALVAGSVLGTFLVLEAGFRLAAVSVGTVQINRGTVRPSDDNRLQFDLRPGARVRAEVDYRINGFGMRNPEVAEEKPAGVQRIAVLGDSIAFGYWVAEEQAFPRQLEAMLGGPGRVEVLDFGVPGYNLEQEIETLRVKALRFAPDVVVVAFCLNDLEGLFSYEYGLTVDRTARGRTIGGRLIEGVLARSVLFSWLEYRMAELEARRRYVEARNPISGPLYDQAVSEQKRALVGQLSVLGSLLRPRGIAGVVAIFPTFGNRFAAYPHRELHRVVAQAAEESGLLAVDLLDCFQAYDFRDVRVDVVHPNPMGHRIAAHGIRDGLCAHGFRCADGPPVRCTDYRKADFPSVRGY
jgi:lysophospholipase L1-like esterase